MSAVMELIIVMVMLHALTLMEALNVPVSLDSLEVVQQETALVWMIASWYCKVYNVDICLYRCGRVLRYFQLL